MARTGIENQWTILSLIQWSETYLAEKGIESPRLNAELMLASALSCDRIDLYTRFDRPLVREELDRYKALLRRRVKHEPLQYILGHVDFYGRRFLVRPGVLIPRPETEHIVEVTLALMKKTGIQSPRILDVGTGSGCIAITLAAEIESAAVTAIDVSTEALKIAAKNVGQYSMNGNITVREVDILDTGTEIPGAGEYDFVVSNPPYIPRNEWDLLAEEIRLYEPKYALTDEADGFTYIKRLAALAPGLLKKDGWLICEIGYNQFENAKLIFSSRGACEIQCWNDLSGIQRIIGGSW